MLKLQWIQNTDNASYLWDTGRCSEFLKFSELWKNLILLLINFFVIHFLLIKKNIYIYFFFFLFKQKYILSFLSKACLWIKQNTKYMSTKCILKTKSWCNYSYIRKEKSCPAPPAAAVLVMLKQAPPSLWNSV